MEVYIRKKIMHSITYCTYNPIYVFPEKEFRGLSPNSYIHVSVSDPSRKYIHLSQMYECRNWDTEHNNSVLEIRRLHSFISGKWEYRNANRTFILDSHWPFICSAVCSMRLTVDFRVNIAHHHQVTYNMENMPSVLQQPYSTTIKQQVNEHIQYTTPESPCSISFYQLPGDLPFKHSCMTNGPFEHTVAINMISDQSATNTWQFTNQKHHPCPLTNISNSHPWPLDQSATCIPYHLTNQQLTSLTTWPISNSNPWPPDQSATHIPEHLTNQQLTSLTTWPISNLHPWPLGQSATHIPYHLTNQQLASLTTWSISNSHPWPLDQSATHIPEHLTNQQLTSLSTWPISNSHLWPLDQSATYIPDHLTNQQLTSLTTWPISNSHPWPLDQSATHIPEHLTNQQLKSLTTWPMSNSHPWPLAQSATLIPDHLTNQQLTSLTTCPISNSHP